jgi:hypothetical protein
MSALKLRFVRKGAAVSAGGGTIAYDTTIGSAVDANGFTTLPLRSGANRYFIGAGGSDSNTGLSHAQRFATLGKAISMIVAGNGDQALIAEGTTLNETLPKGGDANGWIASKSGFSALYPTVFSSYDPADPTNTAKYGRGDQRNARPVLTGSYVGVNVGNGTYGNIAIVGIDHNPGSLSGNGLNFLGAASNILLENNIFRALGLSHDTGEAQTVSPTTPRLIIRNNSIYGNWLDSGHTGGIYIAGINGVTIEDNVIWHTGWKVGATRDDTTANGGLVGDQVFRHPIYAQTNTSNVTVRRNLFMDNASDAGIARGDNVLWTENVSIRNPAGTGLGGGPSYNTERPNGVLFEASYNLSMAAIDLTSSNPSGYGYTTSNGEPGSKVHHNLLIRSTVENGPNALAFSAQADFNQPSYVAFQNNISYHWNGATSYYAAGGVFPSQSIPFTSYDNNAWDSAASGTNVYSQGLTYPNAYTEAQLYAALTPTFASVTDYASLASYASAHPEAHVQRTLRSLAFTGYGLS